MRTFPRFPPFQLFSLDFDIYSSRYFPILFGIHTCLACLLNHLFYNFLFHSTIYYGQLFTLLYFYMPHFLNNCIIFYNLFNITHGSWGLRFYSVSNKVSLEQEPHV